MVNTDPANSDKTANFRSGKSRLAAVAIWLPSTLVLVYVAWLLLDNNQGPGSYFLGFIYLVIYAMLGWMWFDTSYMIRGNVLAYRSGPMQGKIAISSIRKIEKRKELYGGIKPALSSRGLIIHYNHFDDIYLSPGDLDGFIQELIKRNPAIKTISQFPDKTKNIKVESQT